MARLPSLPPLSALWPLLLLFVLALFPSPLEVQQIGPGDGERLKAQLLANLNKYGGELTGPGRAKDGPLEPIGASSPPGLSFAQPTGGALSPFPGLPELLALLRPSSTPAPTSEKPVNADRRYQPPPNGTGRKEGRGKAWRERADLVGDWRRKMYKMLKTIRRKGRREDGTGTGSHHQQQQPVLLFGPPSLMDARRAEKLARIFGVENRRRKGPNKQMKRGGRKHLHSNELRRQGTELRRGRGTAPVESSTASGTRSDDDWDIYGDETELETKGLDQEGGQEGGEEEQFEIVYVPALKRSGGDRRRPAEEQAREEQREEEGAETNLLEEVPPTGPKLHSPPPLTPSPPALPPPAPAPVQPVPLLPLQFPTLLPPLVSFTLPPALNPLVPPPTSTAQSPANEKEFLRELENVPEDYVDEQERRLPCLQRPPSDTPPSACKKARSRPAAASELAVQTAASQLDEQFPWDENREMCNSARLRSLIQQSIVPSSVEKSKRVLQQRAEAQFGAFYNVVCGTGFFSYIAHTDEFCLVALQDVHCYVFSPVCASQLSIASGIAKQRVAGNRRQRRKKAGRSRHFLNRN